jgi:hypothetical protein
MLILGVIVHRVFDVLRYGGFSRLLGRTGPARGWGNRHQSFSSAAVT